MPSSNTKGNRLSAEEPNFSQVTRRLLFGTSAHTALPRDKQIPGAGAPATGQPRRHVRTKITLNLDGDLVEAFKQRGAAEGRAYQLLINDALREYVEGTRPERLAREVGQILLSDPSFISQVLERVGLQDEEEP